MDYPTARPPQSPWMPVMNWLLTAEPSRLARPIIVIAGDSDLAAALWDAADEAGWEVAAPEEAEGELPELIVDCGGHESLLQGGPQLLLCDAAPLAASMCRVGLVSVISPSG